MNHHFQKCMVSCWQTLRYTLFEDMQNFPRMSVAQWYLYSLKEYVNPLCVSWFGVMSYVLLLGFHAMCIDPSQPSALPRLSRGSVLG